MLSQANVFHLLFLNYWWGNPKKMIPYFEKNLPPLENQHSAQYCYCMCWMPHFIQSRESREYKLVKAIYIHLFQASQPKSLILNLSLWNLISSHSLPENFKIFPIIWIRRMCGIVSITLRESNLLFICTKIGSVCIGS